jgi:4-alpha-methyl-delta7-sterol-4alpha-methyl oxidase
MHCTMRRGWLFPRVHSVHHRIHTPWAITGHYVHPVEYVLPGNDGATFHDVHHAKVKGNYAGFLAWVDGVFGTYSRGYAQDRAQRHTHATPTDA